MRITLALPLALTVLGLTASAASAQSLPGAPGLPGGPIRMPPIGMPVEPPQATLRIYNCKPIWIFKDGKITQEEICTGFQLIPAPPGSPIGSIRP